MINVRHILSLSGGKDSAALAVYLRDKIPEMEYIFHDTDKELPETYEYLYKLEAILGKKITYTTSERSFDKWLKVFGGMIPSNHRRWCTKMLKIRPFEDYVGDDIVINYVGLRADERRDGYISPKPNITAVHPFKEDGLVKADIINILEESGLGLPGYTEWGRSRSGCFFCFYQQKIEWVRLKEKHPDLFEQAKAYEYANNKNGNPFYWNKNESLAQLEKPARMKQIVKNWEKKQLLKKKNAANQPLAQVLGGLGQHEEPEREGCLICGV
ncbi:Phosphoadenosine phosphosulfate reductase [Pseudodesulfovibrio profundus]|uniref:Phosphoadenosine phosphosulfate reductase n=1 Tax=Pseudodesulfovibrio profundus TaxID=57320 RepID=A0A2C8F738_9BACT|nr:phosphoadenosine phosphosulfate reductase family protein [Pseudodesulfovibrio profundus]SOB58236.1 Phosphoadenosine phosphosulfate reductase [Pseudodesulfovibrio profundus]